MAKKHLMILAMVCLSVASFHQVNGRLLAENEEVESEKTVVKIHQLKGGDAIRSNRPVWLTAKLSDLDITKDDFINHWAVYGTIEGNYHGTTAKMNVYDLPELTGHQASSAALALWNNKGVDNTIAAGVHVYPDLYHDNKVHFFTFWTGDGSRSTGCYNLLCPGFVTINSSELKPGAELFPVSVYDGEQRYITISIKKDEKTGDWSLYREDLGTTELVGFWPKTLFSNLAETASGVQWGGTVSYIKGEKSPPMGSGHFPIEREGKAAYFKNIGLFDGDGDPINSLDGVENSGTDQPDCYKVSSFEDSSEQAKDDGYMFYYGGPGGCN